MPRNLFKFFLSLPVFIIIFIFVANCEVFAAAVDTVYSRNGEVYVMIGEGKYMGVYANQKLVGGNRVTQKPDGVKLFGDATLDPATGKPKMSYYQSIAVDQFRNIYVLAGKLDPGLIAMPKDTYFPVDPPKDEGIVGVGNDGGVEYHDVINHVDSPPGQYHRTEPFPATALTQKNDVTGFCWVPGAAPRGEVSSYAWVAPTTPPQPMLGKYQAYAGRQADIRRIPLNHWYLGRIAWNDSSPYQIHCGAGPNPAGRPTVTWQVKYDVKVQRINLWISHFVDAAYVPAGVVPTRPPDPVITPSAVIDEFEKVFDTTNLEYKRRRATGCGESSHPGVLGETTANVQTCYRLGFTTTGAGRRYVYSSLPTPTIKKGLIRMVAGNTYGIPQTKSDPYYDTVRGVNFLDPSQKLFDNTVSIGAATKDPLNDYVYTAPLTFNGWDVIDFAVADQWDGTGGVRYMLLQSSGDPNKKFDLARNKKLKWNKMRPDYSVAVGANASERKIVDDEMVLPNEAKVIAGDGSGSVYYLTDPRAVYDGASGGDTFWGKDSSPSSLKPLATPGKPDGPIVLDTSTGKMGYRWYRKYSARAATELFQVEYYNKTITPINNFTVGDAEAIVLEDYADPNGTVLITRGQPEQIPPGVHNIKVALATINLAGPPVGNEERMCVDIVPSNAAPESVKDVAASTRDSAGNATDITVPGNPRPRPKGDEIAEDTQYRCYMENAPPRFSTDLIRKNTISGSALVNENQNNYKGGFDYAIRPGTACYYWRVEMVEPMKKVLTPDAGFTTTPALPRIDAPRTVTLSKVTSTPISWPGSPGVNITDGFWYCSRGPNADLAPSAENSAAAEATPDFAFTPKEPGVYKISLIASAKKWDYSVLGYPSYITDRETAAGCKDGTTHYLFCDNGEGGGTAGNGIKDGGETYVAERYVVVNAQKTAPNDYIKEISITGPQDISENKVDIWTASAKVRFVKSFNHDNLQGVQPNGKQFMETYNGIGVWDYPATAVADWGLPALHDGVGENYVIGAPGWPANAKKSGASFVIDPKLRNFGEVPPGGNPIAATPELVGVNATIYGTSPLFALWVTGAGTNANPTIPINKADRGAIEYEWYLAAEEKVNAGGQIRFIGTKIEDGSARKCPDILIAKGRLSDEGTFAGDNSKTAVKWVNGYTSADRYYTVKVNLRYAFDMPLDPGNYFLYIKFKYPKVKWEGRSPKKDKSGNFINSAGAIVAKESDAAFAYYDLVKDGDSNVSSTYCAENWIAGNAGAFDPTTEEPCGLKIKVKDLQPPQAYFICEDANLNPKSTTALDTAAPAGGVMFKGATTGDPFPGKIAYKVCDNNPNKQVTSSLMAMVGPSAASLAWKEYQSEVQKTEEAAISFDLAMVKTALENTINPTVTAKLPGQIQDAKDIAVNKYPGYGINAPYWQAFFKITDSKAAFTQSLIPYDMTGNIPMYAAGQDGSGNRMSDFDKDGKYNELLNMVYGTPAEQAANAANVKMKSFPKAPADLVLVDNDAPSIRFTALRARDGVVREYVINGTGGDISTIAARPPVHDSNHDDLEWDPSEANRLRFITRGKFEVATRDLDLNGNEAQLTSNQNNPMQKLLPFAFDNTKCIPLDKIKRSSPGNEVKVDTNASGQDNFILKFNNRNVSLSPLYNDFSPVETVVFDFDKILSGNGKELALIEDSRTQFTIKIVDNVEGIIAPSLTAATATSMSGNCLVDTKDLGEAETLVEVMSGWKPKGLLLETYGIFRNPTPTGNVPYMVLVAKDKANNSTVLNIPVTILHTFMKNDVINVESKRTE